MGIYFLNIQNLKMSELVDQISKLEAKAHALKESRKYLEALKKFDELITM